MKFQVPQFVEVEDKIFWKLTLKQFIYLAGGGGLCVVFFLFIPINFLAILCMVPVVALSLSLAFYRYNNRPFINLLESATMYAFNSRLYIWRKVDEPVKLSAKAAPQEDLSMAFVPKLSDSKLKDMTWSLDVKQEQNPVTHGDKTQ